MLGAYNGVILQADVSESADMSRSHRVAIFSGPTNRHDKSQRVNRPYSSFSHFEPGYDVEDDLSSTDFPLFSYIILLVKP